MGPKEDYHDKEILVSNSLSLSLSLTTNVDHLLTTRMRSQV